MQIRHFLYNCFLIEQGEIKIAIDPGQNLWLFDLRSLIPKSEWSSISHVLVTHGDPDHYWQTDRLAAAVNAPLVLNKTMVDQVSISGSRLLVHRSLIGEFSERLVEVVRKARVGDPTDPSTQIGPIANRPHYESVLARISAAEEAGQNYQPEIIKVPPLYAWPPKPLAALRYLFIDILYSRGFIYFILAFPTWWYLTPSLETITHFEPGSSRNNNRDRILPGSKSGIVAFGL